MLPFFFEIARAGVSDDGGLVTIAFMRKDDAERSLLMTCHREAAEALRDELGSALQLRDK